MNVSELSSLTHWVEDEIVDTGIPDKYQKLLTILQQNSRPNQQKAPFANQKDALIELLKGTPIYSLTKDQIRFLHALGIAQAVGNEGVRSIEDILYKNVIDVATSAQKLQHILQELNKGIEKSNQIKSGLEDCVLEEEYESDASILVRVSFTGLASMSNVTDFKNWGKVWYEIGRGIAMVHDSSPEDIKIIGATNGSIVIELAMIASIATTTSGIILAGLKVAEKVLEIRKKAEEIRNLKLNNKKLAQDMEKEAENEKKTGIEKITESTIIELQISKDIDGEKITAFTKSIKNLVNFIESGGEVDFILPKNETESDEDDNTTPKYESLRLAFQEIRQIENKIKLLEP